MPSGRLSAALEVLAVATRLGLTSFGGPVAHLGYFHREYVVRRRWLDEATYADVVALCQFLPGPASSQVGIAVGILRAGLPGGLAAWLGFTLPSALALVLFALFIRGADLAGAGWLLGLKIAAVAVVAQAVWGMARALCPDRERASIAIAAALVVTAWPGAWGQVAVIALVAALVLIAWPGAWGQVLVIVAAGLVGVRLLPGAGEMGPAPGVRVPFGRALGGATLILFFALLVALPLARYATGNHIIAVVDAFYRSGALVFGGGHVVLPLLQAEVVPPGWVSREQFLAGYGAAQAVPGPLFTLSAYLGAVMHPAPTGWAGAALALAAIFLPAFLLVVGTLPLWNALRARPAFRAALRGINAAVVGLLLAALYDPVWTGAIHAPADFALALVAFGLLALWSAPPWLVVALSAAGAQAIAWLR